MQHTIPCIPCTEMPCSRGEAVKAAQSGAPRVHHTAVVGALAGQDGGAAWQDKEGRKQQQQWGPWAVGIKHPHPQHRLACARHAQQKQAVLFRGSIPPLPLPQVCAFAPMPVGAEPPLTWAAAGGSGGGEQAGVENRQGWRTGRQAVQILQSGLMLPPRHTATFLHS